MIYDNKYARVSSNDREAMFVMIYDNKYASASSNDRKVTFAWSNMLKRKFICCFCIKINRKDAFSLNVLLKQSYFLSVEMMNKNVGFILKFLRSFNSLTLKILVCSFY